VEELGGGAHFLRWWFNCCFFVTADGVVVFDTGLDLTGNLVVRELRRVSEAPVRYIIYGHGHADHAFGAAAFLRDAEERGHRRPTVLSQENLPLRFDRYRETLPYQGHINRLQFGIPSEAPQFVREFLYPDETFRESHRLQLGGLTFELRAARGETDDACWMWVPELHCAAVSDLWVWSCPNIGNPLKVQRYELEWAEALEEIAAREPQTVLPGHGPALRGAGKVKEALSVVSRALRHLRGQVLEMLNKGMWPDEILRSFSWPEEFAGSPYLAPIYGNPYFVVQGILRRYHGWYDGNPSHLFPPPRGETASEVLALLKSPQELLKRAQELAKQGKRQLSLQLVDIIIEGGGEGREPALEMKGRLLEELAAEEPSLIARNLYLAGAREARRQREGAGEVG
jgi:alkyl sulfatase BDS1-like metallo-beta-lactamase superfamily hydrolase